MKSVAAHFDVMNHTELVNRAVKWLRNSLHCKVVLSELVAYTRSGETPDAIGWVHNEAILVECKRSRSDFYAERKKRARNKNMPALGVWRFYLTPPGLLNPDEIIKGWGLYEVHGNRIIHKGGCKYRNAGKPCFESDRDSEVAMLVSALSRIHNHSLEPTERKIVLGPPNRLRPKNDNPVG